MLDLDKLSAELDEALRHETQKSFRKLFRRSISQRFWFFVHNAIAHPLLCFNKSWADRFHDWTADKM